jgi:hypothetical protein
LERRVSMDRLENVARARVGVVSEVQAGPSASRPSKDSTSPTTGLREHLAPLAAESRPSGHTFGPRNAKLPSSEVRPGPEPKVSTPPQSSRQASSVLAPVVPRPVASAEIAPSSLRPGTQMVPIFKNKLWRKALNEGMFNGLPVYIHYTSLAGLQSIMSSKSISDGSSGERRPGAKAGVYMNPANQRLSPENAESLLFLGNERYLGSADCMVILAAKDIDDLGAVTKGSWAREMKSRASVIPLTLENLLYAGPNRFPDAFPE